MKYIIILKLFLIITSCTIISDLTEPVINTDMIAGNWSGKISGLHNSDHELNPRDIQMIIIAGCTIGNVCGKLSEDNYCPGDIILLKVDGTRFEFLSETVSGVQHICGTGDLRKIELELRSDETIYFVNQNGATYLTGILYKK